MLLELFLPLKWGKALIRYWTLAGNKSWQTQRRDGEA